MVLEMTESLSRWCFLARERFPEERERRVGLGNLHSVDLDELEWIHVLLSPLAEGGTEGEGTNCVLL